MKKRFQLFLGASALLLAACGSGNAATDSSAGTTSNGEALAAEQVINLSVTNELATANPLYMQDIQTTTGAQQYLEGLFRLDENNVAQPALAADYQVSEDGLTYTFTLREDAKWSNGDPVTAHHFVYSWQKAVNPETAAPYAYMFEPIVNGTAINKGEMDPSELGVEATSDTEFVVHLNVPVAYFPAMLTNPYFFPLHEAFVEEHGDAYGTSSETALSNGPFELVDWEGGKQSWSYEKNEDYWDAENVNLEAINVQVLKETATALSLYEAGQIDNALLSGEYALQMQGSVGYLTESIANTTFLQFNLENESLANLNLRKALNGVINREELVNIILGNGSRPTTGFVPDQFAVDPETGADYTEEQPEFAGFDLEAAQQSLEAAKAELGTDTISLELTADDDETSKKVSQYVQGAIQNNLEGVEVNLVNIPKNNRIAKGGSGEFDIILGGWNAIIPDPVNMLDLGHSKTPFNHGRFQNAEYDALLDAAEGEHANDEALRYEDLRKAEAIFVNELGVAPIYHSSEAFLWNPDIKDIVRHSVGARYDFKNAYVVE